ncbi:putative peptide maturation dehydrogenase [Stenotrophomonas sp. SY1]|uniref:putative peptide maturation dehydrogenase n=1 Tax=Stenotrophomonas sp. SY1 TaxID=477235 RepID=UPI001E4897D0|nr:putative peptide maturation dehydrogenase [Stenotrophomonas sp. SY1]MCD9085535.1 putative peptide maturation dehydrogenase [Stenotrophomonas sp. SY1]
MKLVEVRRCAVLFLEPTENIRFSLGAVLSGGDGLLRHSGWQAIAPHLEDGCVEIEEWMAVLLGRLSPSRWIPWQESGGSYEEVLALIQKGLIVAAVDLPGMEHFRRSDERVRAADWWPLAAACAIRGRWSDVDSAADMERNGTNTVAGLLKTLGNPMPEQVIEPDLYLSRVEPDVFDHLLRRRVTCRNFSGQQLETATFARMMERVFAATHVEEPAPGLRFLKRSSPSGGGFHATDAYILVQRVDGVAPGLYRYLPESHALSRIGGEQSETQQLAMQMVAGQHWFANAPVIVALVATYRRSFWKYRNHSKAHRALILDGGHLSQTLYLSATDLGMGAFVTAAINEKQIETMFSLDPLEKGVIAVCGFGHRADAMAITEFDPGGAVWPAMDG